MGSINPLYSQENIRPEIVTPNERAKLDKVDVPDVTTAYDVDLSEYRRPNPQLLISGGERSLQESRALSQTNFELVGKGIGNVLSTAAAEILKIPGYAAGLAATPFVGFEDAIDNAWIQGVNWLKENTTDQITTVYTPPSIEESGLLKQLANPYFWASDGANGLGFMLSYLVPGRFLSTVGIGNRVSKLVGKWSTAAAEAQQGAMLSRMSEQIMNTMLGKSRRAIDFGKIAADVDSAVSIGVNTLLESAAEANEAYKGALAIGKNKDEAGESAASTFALNMLVLGASNTVVEKYLFNGFSRRTGVDRITSAVIKGEKTVDLVSKPPRRNLSKFFSNKKTLAEDSTLKPQRIIDGIPGALAVGIGQEGLFEEGLQTTGAQVLEKDSDANIFDIVGKYLSNVGSMFGTDKDGIDFGKAVLLGGILGGGASAIGEVRQTQNSNRFLFGGPDIRRSKFEKFLGLKDEKKSEGFVSFLRNRYSTLRKGLNFTGKPGEDLLITQALEGNGLNMLVNHYEDLIAGFNGDLNTADIALRNDVEDYLQRKLGEDAMIEIEGETTVQAIANSLIERIRELTAIPVPMQNQDLLEFIDERTARAYFYPFLNIEGGRELAKAHIEDYVDALAERQEKNSGVKMSERRKSEIARKVKDSFDRYSRVVQDEQVTYKPSFFDFDPTEAIGFDSTLYDNQFTKEKDIGKETEEKIELLYDDFRDTVIAARIEIAADMDFVAKQLREKISDERRAALDTLLLRLSTDYQQYFNMDTVKRLWVRYFETSGFKLPDVKTDEEIAAEEAGKEKDDEDKDGAVDPETGLPKSPVPTTDPVGSKVDADGKDVMLTDELIDEVFDVMRNESKMNAMARANRKLIDAVYNNKDHPLKGLYNKMREEVNVSPRINKVLEDKELLKEITGVDDPTVDEGKDGFALVATIVYNNKKKSEEGKGSPSTKDKIMSMLGLGDKKKTEEGKDKKGETKDDDKKSAKKMMLDALGLGDKPKAGDKNDKSKDKKDDSKDKKDSKDDKKDGKDDNKDKRSIKDKVLGMLNNEPPPGTTDEPPMPTIADEPPMRTGKDEPPPRRRRDDPPMPTAKDEPKSSLTKKDKDKDKETKNKPKKKEDNSNAVPPPGKEKPSKEEADDPEADRKSSHFISLVNTTLQYDGKGTVYEPDGQGNLRPVLNPNQWQQAFGRWASEAKLGEFGAVGMVATYSDQDGMMREHFEGINPNPSNRRPGADVFVVITDKSGNILKSPSGQVIMAPMYRAEKKVDTMNDYAIVNRYLEYKKIAGAFTRSQLRENTPLSKSSLPPKVVKFFRNELKAIGLTDAVIDTMSIKSSVAVLIKERMKPYLTDRYRNFLKKIQDNPGRQVRMTATDMSSGYLTKIIDTANNEAKSYDPVAALGLDIGESGAPINFRIVHADYQGGLQINNKVVKGFKPGGMYVVDKSGQPIELKPQTLSDERIARVMSYIQMLANSKNLDVFATPEMMKSLMGDLKKLTIGNRTYDMRNPIPLFPKEGHPISMVNLDIHWGVQNVKEFQIYVEKGQLIIGNKSVSMNSIRQGNTAAIEQVLDFLVGKNTNLPFVITDALQNGSAAALASAQEIIKAAYGSTQEMISDSFSVETPPTSDLGNIPRFTGRSIEFAESTTLVPANKKMTFSVVDTESDTISEADAAPASIVEVRKKVDRVVNSNTAVPASPRDGSKGVGSKLGALKNQAPKSPTNRFEDGLASGNIEETC